jgi:hypothetical protein
MPEYICPVCNGTFEADRPRKFCSKDCRYSKKTFDENGKFVKDAEDIKRDREKIRKEFGMPDLKDPMEVIRETNENLQNLGLMDKKLDPFKFTKEFYMFMNFGVPHSYYWGLDKGTSRKVHDMQKRYQLKSGMKLDTGEVYAPIDDMYGTPGEGDSFYDYGRIPTSHLVALCVARLGVAHTVCNRPATDMFDNDFEFVKRSDPNGDPVKNKNVNNIMSYMDRTRLHKRFAESVEFTDQTGNGMLVVEKYEREAQNPKRWKLKAPNTRPEKFQTFSAYHMTPTNAFDTKSLDYDRNSWKFRGGVHTSQEIHESRSFVFTLKRYPYQLRDLALPETAFVSFLCLMNASYYLLKSLSQLGSVIVGIQSDKEYPTTQEITNYFTMLEKFKANDFFVLGRGATLQIENAANKIGQGIPQILEYFKEDISAACVFPKNELFGRVEGGGISGAGALVAKETYLNSNISVKFGIIKRDILWILQNMCNFTGLEGLIPKMNIDLHKTEEQRLNEGLLRQSYEQQKVITSQTQLGNTLYKKQIALQKEMADYQMKMFKQNPKKMMEMSMMDENNTSDKDVNKTDFNEEYEELRLKNLLAEREYRANERILDMLERNTRNLKMINAQDDFAGRIYRDREKRAKD